MSTAPATTSTNHITSLRVEIVSQDGWDTLRLTGWTPHDDHGGGGRFALTLDADYGPFDTLRDLITASCPSAEDWLTVRSGQIAWLDTTVGEVADLSVGWIDDGLNFTVNFPATRPSKPRHHLLTLSRDEANILLGALQAWEHGVRPFAAAGTSAAAGLRPHEMRGPDVPDSDTIAIMAGLRDGALVLPQPATDVLIIQ